MLTTTAARVTVTEMSEHPSTFRHKMRRRSLGAVTPALAVLAGLIIAGCGTSSSGSSARSANPEGSGAHASAPYGASGGGSRSQPPAAAAPATMQPPANTSQAPAGGQTQAPTAANGIPQGNGGDQDADNNGGPSDGDGNV
jgi:hypothetical protein